MTDKEKKAIEEFKKLKDYKQTYYGYTWFKVEVCTDDKMKQNIDIILNLIEKQQKEIEDLKEKIKNSKIEDEKIVTQFGQIIEKKRWQDKIKAKIEELEDMYNKLPKNPKEHLHSRTEYLIVIGELQSLLEKE